MLTTPAGGVRRPQGALWLVRLVLAAVVSGLAWVAGGGQPVAACSCAPVTPQESFDQATDVFVGRVEGVDDTDEVQEPYEVRYVMRIDGVFKGDAFATQLITTPQRGGLCGVEMAVGDSYLVHAIRRPAALVTSLCSGNEAGGLDAASAALGAAATDVQAPVSGVDPAVTDRVQVSARTESVLIPRWVWSVGIVLVALAITVAGIVLGRRAGRARGSGVRQGGLGRDRVE